MVLRGSTRDNGYYSRCSHQSSGCHDWLERRDDDHNEKKKDNEPSADGHGVVATLLLKVEQWLGMSGWAQHFYYVVSWWPSNSRSFSREALGCHYRDCSVHPESYFGVILSICHLIADGHTYYTIRDMVFSNNHEVTKMDPKRIQGSDEEKVATLGPYQAEYGPSSTFLILSVAGTLWTTIAAPIFGPKYHTRYIEVDKDKMERIKREATTTTYRLFPPTMCSHHGCLLSLKLPLDSCWSTCEIEYWTIQTCTPEITKGVILYTPGDYESPALIRRSLTDLRRVTNNDQPLPTLFQVRAMTMVSNLAPSRRDQES